MKNVLFCVVFALLFILASCSKDQLDDQMKSSEVPELVVKSFNSEYPSARNARWRSAGLDFEAVYQKNGREKSILFAADGKLLAEKIELSEREVPLPIRQYLNENYIGSALTKAVKKETPAGVFYDVTLLINDREVEFVFDANDELLKKGMEEGTVLENEEN